MTKFRHTNLLAALSHHAEIRGHATALVFLPNGEDEGARLTYAELRTRVGSLSDRLAEKTKSGERALLIYAPGLEFIVAFLACLRAGVIAVPSSPANRGSGADRLDGILTDCTPQVILTDDTNAGSLRKAQVTPELIVTGDDSADGGEKLATNPKPDRNSVAFLQYTSGSTGTPRGVVVTHENLVANLDLMQSAYGHEDDAVFVSWLPHFHDMGLIGTQLLALYAGGQCVIMPPLKFIQRPQRWLRALTRFAATATGAPNFAFDLCCEKVSDEDLADLNLSSLRVLFSGAEPISPSTLRRFVGRFGDAGLSPDAVCASYGLAEATLVVTGGRSGQGLKTLHVNRNALAAGFISWDQPDLLLAGCGKALAGQRTLVVNPSSGEPLADGEVGEIQVEGPSVTPGYWGKLKAGDIDPVLRTGDQGVWVRGELYVVGRLKETIIVRGRNLYPDDLEATLRESDPQLAAHRAVAFGAPADSGETLVVMQEMGARVDSDELASLADTIRGAISREHQVAVSAVVFVRLKTIGRTTSGKPMRSACRDAFCGNSLSGQIERFDFPDEEGSADSLSDAPETVVDLETWVTRIIQQRLGLSGVQPGDSLSGLGLDSLGLVSLISELETRVGRSLPVEALGGQATVKELARSLAGEQLTTESPRNESKRQPSPIRDGPYWRERFWLKGPWIRGVGLPYSPGMSMLRALVSRRALKKTFCEEISRLCQIIEETEATHDPEQIVQQSLLNHLWKGWRLSALGRPGNWRRWVRCEGHENVPNSGVVLVCDHSPFRGLMWNLPLVKERQAAVIGEFGPENLRRTGLPALAAAQEHSQNIPRAVKRAVQLKLAIETLRAGGVVIIFGDEDEGRGGLSREFHGRWRTFRPGFARLAMETDSAVIPLTAEMDSTGVVSFRFHEQIAVPSRDSAGEKRVLNSYADFLWNRWRNNLANVDWYILRKHLDLPPIEP